MVETFGKELGTLNDTEMGHVPLSRQQYEFEKSLEEHKKKMKQVEKDIVSIDKKLTGLEADTKCIGNFNADDMILLSS